MGVLGSKNLIGISDYGLRYDEHPKGADVCQDISIRAANFVVLSNFPLLSQAHPV
jgi:hypothetical protein